MDENSGIVEKDAAPQNLLSQFARFNNDRIRKINENHLIYVEIHLDFSEKTSLIFLLVADNNTLRGYFLQQLIVLSKNRHNDRSDILSKWLRELQREAPGTWRDKFIEALCIMQAKKLLTKLQLNVNDLIMTYLPHIRDQALFIHRVVKTLYTFCEQMDVEKATKLIEYMAEKYPTDGRLDISDGNDPYLEAHLLHWIVGGIISLGDERAPGLQGENRQQCQLKPILQFLKRYDNNTLRNNLQDTVEHFNYNPSSVRTDDNRAQYTRRQIGGDSRGNVNSISQDRYVIRRERAGILLIINQMSFHKSTDPALSNRVYDATLKTRDGSNEDKKALVDTFASYGFRTVTKDNARHDEIKRFVEEIVIEGVNYDSVVVCILSHGHRGVVYGADSIAVDLEAVQDTLASDRLINKPKILIVQACQGRDTLQAVEIQSGAQVERDGPNNATSTRFSDFLTCVSSIPGYTSFRDREKGSWFIQTLCEKLAKHSDVKHFVDILTVVSREVQEMRAGGECMVPIYNSVLRRDLFFPRRLPSK